MGEPRFTNEYEFDNRSQKRENLLIIGAGFQPWYWNEMFSRIKKYSTDLEGGLDVCICVPSADGTRLREMAKENDWSYLRIDENKLSLVQNTAIRLHPDARWIYKMDEDILITEGYFKKLKNAYKRTSDIYPLRAGFAAPLLNINGFGSYFFLKALGKLDDFEDRYGKYILTGLKGNVYFNVAAGRYLWENSVPFDETMKKVSEAYAGEVKLCPIRFSIGAILFKRSLWSGMNGFEVARPGVLGVDEEQLCAYCMNQIMGISVAMDVCAGHMGFGTQKNVVRDFFESRFF